MGGGVSKKSPAAGGGGAAPPKTTKSKAKNELDFKVGELVNIGTLVAESGGMLAALDPTFNAVGEAAEGNYGVVVGGSGLAIVDMSDPKNLKKIRGIDTGVLSKAGSGTAALSHDGKYLYVAGGLGIAIVDMRFGPERAKRISTCDTGVLCHKSGGHVLCGEVGTFSQNLIFVTGGLGVAIVDVSDPAEPKFLSSVSTGVLTTSSQCSSALLTCAKGTFLYVAGEPGLAVIDVNDPKAPKAVGLGKEGEGSPVKTGVGATYWDDNKCRGNHVLLNIDPSLPSQAKPGAASREKEADRMIAYVVGGKGLAVFDLKHPCAPELLTTITDTSVLITQSGGHAALCSTRLLVSGARGLCVLDASKPRTPAIVGKVKVGVATNAGSLSVASSDGIYAFCVGGKGVATIDLSKLDALRQKFEDESAFWFVSADKIRSSSEKTLPAMQELQGREGWLSRQDVPFSTACAGNYANGKFLAVSHRWEDSKKPDQQGVQLAEVKKYLAANPAVEWVWYDYWCMAQNQDAAGGESRTLEEVLEFKAMLARINTLYLGVSVLVLLDMSYMSRFWTQFEAWLSLQQCSTEGVRPAPKDATRCTVVSIHNAATTSMAGDLLKMWGADEMKPEAAVAVLSKPDIAVTNQSDKDGQLPKVLKLSDKVKEALA